MLGLGGTASSEASSPRSEVSVVTETRVKVTHLTANGSKSEHTTTLPGGHNAHSYVFDEAQTFALTGVAGQTRGMLCRGGWDYLFIDVRDRARYVKPDTLQEHNGLDGHFEIDVQAEGSESLNIGTVPLLIARLPVGDAQSTAVSLHPFLDTGVASTIDIDSDGNVVLYAIGRGRMPGTTHVALETPSGSDTSADIRLAIDTTGVEAEFVQPAGLILQVIGQFPVVSAMLHVR